MRKSHKRSVKSRNVIVILLDMMKACFDFIYSMMIGIINLIGAAID